MDAWANSRIYKWPWWQNQGVKIMMGKTKTVIGRPLNKVYHLELVQENEEIRKEDDKRKGEGEGERETT